MCVCVVCMHAWMDVCMYVRVCVSVYVWMFACLHLCLQVYVRRIRGLGAKNLHAGAHTHRQTPALTLSSSPSLYLVRLAHYRLARFLMYISIGI